jgi:hypothetical protein
MSAPRPHLLLQAGRLLLEYNESTAAIHLDAILVLLRVNPLVTFRFFR